MLSNAATRATQLAAAPTRVLSDLVQSLAALFRVTVPADRERVSHLWWVAGLTTAGAAVRFWGLGAVGLHGDEETMAMAARHIVIDGLPILPSGMFYPRGLTQLYLMALSISIFGESEWALRLPSALCGIALIVASFAVGRRFLRPHWNLAFVATIAFLPEIIVYSQTARMYIFMLTAIMASLACLFAWERTDRIGWLVAAVVVMLIGVELHTLAVGTALVFLLPGVVSGDLRKLILGAAAAAVLGIGFVAINAWLSTQYPDPPADFAADLDLTRWRESPAPQAFALTFDIALAVVGIAIAFFTLHLSRAVTVRAARVVSAALLLVGVGLQLALFYHLAGLCYLAGIVLAHRYGSTLVIRPRIATFAIAVALLTLVHGTMLASRPGSIIKIVGAMTGQPSVWPYVRVAQLSEAAGLLTATLLAWGLYQLANNRRVTDYWLLALLGVFAPVFALGLFAWNIPTRYTAIALPFLLLSAFAFAQRGADWLFAQIPRARQWPKSGALAATLTALCAIDPATAGAVINAGYRLHPDHKGAAEFMRSQQITDEDIVLAEDVLQQVYYLGSVDYWLIGKHVARQYVTRMNGRIVDFYTGTPVIATAAALDELLRENPHRRIFIIGSGEGHKDRRLSVRGADLNAVIESDRFEVIFLGRDDITRVLRAVGAERASSRGTRSDSGATARANAARALAARSARPPYAGAQIER